MSLFSKLFGDGGSALNDLKKAAEAAVTDATARLNEAAARLNAEEQNLAQQPVQQPAGEARPAQPVGRGAYDAPPAEENQYNYAGTYRQYFEKIFREDFAAYRVAADEGTDGRSPVYTLFAPDGRQALVVELKSERSSAQRVRKSCAAAGVPYLRFYYDHDGWWNTRVYVTDRIRRALGG